MPQGSSVVRPTNGLYLTFYIPVLVFELSYPHSTRGQSYNILD